MRVFLIFALRSDDRNTLAGEDLRIELSIHGESGTDQTHLLESTVFRSLASCPHNAKQRDRRPALQFVEDQMGRIRSEQSEISASSRKFPNFIGHERDQLIVLSGENQVAHLTQIDAVDDDGRIAAVALSSPVGSNNLAIIVHR